jgi:hypothetical protein
MGAGHDLAREAQAGHVRHMRHFVASLVHVINNHASHRGAAKIGQRLPLGVVTEAQPNNRCTGAAEPVFS